MISMLESYTVKRLDSIFFKGISWALVVMGVLSVGFSIFRGDAALVFSILLLFILPLFFMSFARFRDNVFSLPLMVFLTMYIYIPLTFFSYMGSEYNFGWGLNGLPYSQEYIFDRLIQNLLFLFVCIFSVMATLTLNKTVFIALKTSQKLYGLPVWTVIFLGLIVAGVLASDIAITLLAKAEGTGGSEGLIKFLFFDHAYLFLAGVALLKLNSDITDKQKTAKIIAVGSIAFIFISLGVLAGSKAAFLIIFWFFFLISYMYLRNDRDATVLFPSVKALMVLAIISPLLYLVVFFYRISLTTSTDFNFSTLVFIFDIIDIDVLLILLEDIFYRLSAGGFDRCMLLFTSFSSTPMPEYGTQTLRISGRLSVPNLLMGI